MARQPAHPIMEEPFCPSPLKISTITATAKLDVRVDLDAFFESCHVLAPGTQNTDGIEYAEYGGKKGDVRCKPPCNTEQTDGTLTSTSTSTSTRSTLTRNKNGAPRRGAKEKKRFDNQVTVIVRYDGGRQKANAKVFRNGHIQITGLKTVEGGKTVVGVVTDALRRAGIEVSECSEYRIRLINSDFRAGFEVRRDVLQNLVAHRYGVPCTFEPCIYPGCKIQYWYNECNTSHEGRCSCIGKCIGKGSGQGDGHCKKVTIAVFHSGSVIITGGQSKEQIDAAYGFICDVLRKNYKDVKKPKPMLPFICSSLIGSL